MHKKTKKGERKTKETKTDTETEDGARTRRRTDAETRGQDGERQGTRTNKLNICSAYRRKILGGEDSGVDADVQII